MNEQELCEKAIQLAEQRPVSTTPFEVKNLFPPAEWKRLSKIERITLGQNFSFAVERHEIKGVHFKSEGQTHHNLYIKTE